MIRQFTILDERKAWYNAAIRAAVARGYDALRVTNGIEAVGRSGLGFIRPHARPEVLRRNQTIDWPMMAEHLDMVQDRHQVMCYDNKSAQFALWAKFMPRTVLATSLASGLEALGMFGDCRVIAKADVGASSRNVYVFNTRDSAIAFLQLFFAHGLYVDHCAGGQGEHSAKSTQRGHILIQEFIPHEFTWRVNIVGRRLAAFKRYNHADRPVAQTGNVEPVLEMDETVESLFAFAMGVFAEIGTRWCAIDVLRTADGDWKMLETSLAWPWPSPGRCDEAPFFGTTRRWAEMWDLMFDEYEDGVWTAE